MVSTTCVKFLKMSVFALNLILWLTGVVGVCVAGFFLFLMTDRPQDSQASLWTVNFGDADHMLEQARAIMCILTLITGSVMSIVGFLGCCGAALQHKYLLVTHAGLLGVAVAVEIILTGIIMWQKDQAPRIVEELVLTKIRYSDDYDHEDWRPIHAIQRQLRCCGVNNFNDYIMVNHTIPLSCCSSQLATENHYLDCNRTLGSHPHTFTNDTLIFKRGCGKVVRSDITSLALLGYLVLGTIIFFQVIGFIFSCIIIRNLNDWSDAAKPVVDLNRSVSYLPNSEIQQYRPVLPAYDSRSRSSLGVDRSALPR